jgi:hypothetical protein
VDDDAPRAYRELKNITWIYDKRNEVNKPKLNSNKLDFFSALTYALSSTYLAKTTQYYGTIPKVSATSMQGAGRSLAQGLGITTSKVGHINHKRGGGKMKRFYTKNRFKDEDDW